MFSNSQMWVFKEKNIYIVSREHAETHSFLTVFSCQFKVPLKGLRKINPFFFFEVLRCAWYSDSEVGRGKVGDGPQLEQNRFLSGKGTACCFSKDDSPSEHFV